MTAQLLCRVQNFTTMILPQLGWEQNEISIEFELWQKIICEMGPQSMFYFCDYIAVFNIGLYLTL